MTTGPRWSCTRTAPAGTIPGRAGGAGPCRAAALRAERTRTARTSAWITAALEALRALTPERPVSIEVVSDSTYVVNCFRDRWWEGWLKRDWKNSQRKPVANRDLWEPLLELALAEDVPVSCRWVKGHSGDPWNDVVDGIATTAADSGRGTSGDRSSE